MTTTTTTTTTPVKGMKFAVAIGSLSGGVGTVTMVRNGTVYWRTELWGRKSFKTPLKSWDRFCGEVLEMPQPKQAQASPRMTPAQCEDLHQRAHAAGMAAGEAALPTPMHVVQRVNPFDDNSPVKRDCGLVMDGVCGFAWIKIRPATGSFARWAKTQGLGHKAYTGGYDIRVRGFGQSMERKAAYADAYAAVLNEAGIKAYSESRMD